MHGPINVKNLFNSTLTVINFKSINFIDITRDLVNNNNMKLLIL
jgi:hypothetical protein